MVIQGVTSDDTGRDIGASPIFVSTKEFMWPDRGCKWHTRRHKDIAISAVHTSATYSLVPDMGMHW